MQWIQDPNRSNVDNLNNIRRDASRHFRNKKKAYLKVKIEELEINSKINYVRDLYRSINDFKKGYQPKTKRVAQKLMPHIFFSETVYSACMKFTHSITGCFLYTCYFST